jgi:LysM repeat protein
MPGSASIPARSPARWLAPIALVTAAVAVYAVVAPQGGGDASSSAERTTSSAKERRPSSTTTASRARRARTYTVRAGDTLSGIAERTGVPLSTLTRLNKDVDSQALQTGQRLKLSP